MEEETSQTSLTYNKYKYIINILVTLIIISIVFYICYIPFIRYHYLFTWHVIFGTIAYLLISPLSLMLYDNSWFVKYTRKKKSYIHGILTIIATIFAILSTFLDYYRKEVYKKEYNLIHFESPHAITGLISVILFIFATLTGLLTYNINWFQEKLIKIRPIKSKLFHNIVGQIGYFLGIISICIILNESWFIYYATSKVAIILSFLIILITFWSLINSFISAFHQVNVILNL